MKLRIVALCSSLVLGASVAAWASSCTSITARTADTPATCGTVTGTPTNYGMAFPQCTAASSSIPHFGGCGEPYQPDYQCLLLHTAHYSTTDMTISPAQQKIRDSGSDCPCTLSAPVAHTDGTYGYSGGGCGDG